MSKKEAFIRETKRKSLSLMHNMAYKAESFRLKGLLDNYDPSRITLKSPQRVRTVTFIITRMVRFHGGQTSILHLGTELEKQGYKVCYLVCKEQSPEEMDICASANLPGYKGRVFALNRYMAAIKKEKIKAPDVVVASSWDTVSFAKKFEDSYLMYFIQDYEPLFYKFGEEYLLARDTYMQGLHMVSLGAWNKDMIMRECGGASGSRFDKRPGLKIDVVSFPYDGSAYEYTERDFSLYKDKKKLTIAVYLKFYGKRLPDLIPYMLINTSEKLKEKGITLEVIYFGEAKTFKAEGGTNLGQLSHAEINELYKKADFGMVASMSNISLVPYEMHAAGLPVIEFADGSYPYFFGEDTALLTRIGEKDIAELLINAASDPESLKAMTGKAAEKLKTLSWERTGRKFSMILRSLVKAGV
ncbi:MAG: glycosyltransferase family 4 protein [Lachnospiraceae bacterium]|nr:glycosyltransferase family 4 protein [Lachnospiraceae bacterium]